MAELTLKEKERFFKNQNKVGTVIINHVKKKGLILFGQKATNRQLPEDLRKDTQDYDIMSPTPRKSARRIERKLDRKFKGNFYKTKQAKFGGTFKVVQIIGDKGIVDVGEQKKDVTIVKRKGIKLASLEFQKGQIKKSLADPESKFRHPKDREVLSRIRIAEQRKGTRTSKRIKKKTVPRKVPRNLRFGLPSFDVNPNVNF